VADQLPVDVIPVVRPAERSEDDQRAAEGTPLQHPALVLDSSNRRHGFLHVRHQRSMRFSCVISLWDI